MIVDVIYTTAYEYALAIVIVVTMGLNQSLSCKCTCFGYIQGVSKKTEFCQIEHLQILLVFGEKYLMKFVANPVVSCFGWAISMLLLSAL